MKNHLPKISLNSIRSKLVIGVLAILLPLIGFLIYDNFYAINVIHNQVAESNKNMLSLYMQQIDVNLGYVDVYLTTMASSNMDIQSIDTISDESDRMMTKIGISNKMQDDLGSYRNINGLFFYSVEDNDFIYVFDEARSLSERESIFEIVKSDVEILPGAMELYGRGWFPVNVDGQYYLIRIIQAGNNYIGSWVSAQRILMPLTLIDLGPSGASMLTGSDGMLLATSKSIDLNEVDLNGDFGNYYLTGDKTSYLVVGERSTKGKFNLIAVVPDRDILENLPYLKRIIQVIAFASILLIPISFFFLRKVLLMPINRILSAMKKIRDGDIEIRLPQKKTSDEFIIFRDTFNNMLDQIHDLRISVYEEQISKQKEELRHLQLQVNPHFFMNSLNIIYRMAQSGKNELVQEMSLCLMQYFRYMFRKDMDFVTLKDELQHVRNYIRIQELRFPGSLTSEVAVPEFLLNSPVPPLVVQNFVENSIKYAMTLDKPAHVSIHADILDNGERPAIEIIIKDNGDGFPEDTLAKLRKGIRYFDDKGEHTGIYNVQRRLKLLYDGKAEIHISNGQPSGAEIRIVMPLQPGEQEGRSAG